MTAPAVQLSDGNSGGTGLGQSTTDLISFYGVTPIVQRTSSAQTAVVTTAATNSSPYGFATAAQADGLVRLANELRAALVAVGLITGS